MKHDGDGITVNFTNSLSKDFQKMTQEEVKDPWQNPDNWNDKPDHELHDQINKTVATPGQTPTGTDTNILKIPDI